jgi:hypothetical protein
MDLLIILIIVICYFIGYKTNLKALKIFREFVKDKRLENRHVKMLYLPWALDSKVRKIYLSKNGAEKVNLLNEAIRIKNNARRIGFITPLIVFLILIVRILFF